MKYWQSLKSQMDHTANHLVSAGTPGYTSVTLICLTVVVAMILNCVHKISGKRYKAFEEDEVDALSK
ncbi:MAG: hypothetical protein CTY33_00100 [Methylotenera sp.]|nr:MAG: hypothetical protein CTY33_00100 [Methylotenera sp.]